MRYQHTPGPETAVQERINRRFSGTRGELLWIDGDLECRVRSAETGAVHANEILLAIEKLGEAGCILTPHVRKEPAGDVVLHWKQVGALTYSWEWPAAAWRAAALNTYRALMVLKTVGLTFLEWQPSDVFMAGSQAIAANLGNLVRWSHEHEMANIGRISRFFARPLACAIAGQTSMARRLLRSGMSGLSQCDAEMVLGAGLPTPDTLAHALAWLEATTIPSQSSPWNSYQRETDQWHAAEVETKAAVVWGVVTRLKPSSVLDIGCNQGRFCRIASDAGASVVGVDREEDCMNAFFTDTASGAATPMTAVIMDLRDPSEIKGWGEGWCASAERRLSSDGVLLLAVLHHLLLGARMPPTEFRQCLAALTKRWLLLEFVPPGPGNVYATGPDWYTFEGILDILADDFEKRDCWDCGCRGRRLILLERLNRRPNLRTDDSGQFITPHDADAMAPAHVGLK